MGQISPVLTDVDYQSYTDSHIHTRTHRQTDRQSDRQRERQTDRQTDRQTHNALQAHTDRQTNYLSPPPHPHLSLPGVSNPETEQKGILSYLVSNDEVKLSHKIARYSFNSPFSPSLLTSNPHYQQRNIVNGVKHVSTHLYSWVSKDKVGMGR